MRHPHPVVGRRFRVALPVLIAYAVACAGQSERANERLPGGAGAGMAGGIGGAGGGMAGSGGRIIGAGCEPGFEPLDGTNPRCGGEPCAPLPRTDGRFAQVHCCTTDGRCGSGFARIFSATCFERDRPGTLSAECPTETLFMYYDFVSGIELRNEFPGCCLPDGRCGLDTSESLGGGCVERSFFSDAARSGCESENDEVRFDPISCSP